LRWIFKKIAMDTVVSGIRSTGNLHLGNYFGAVKNFLEDAEGK
jgi:tryptophanyl-tRNA synthetase